MPSLITKSIISRDMLIYRDILFQAIETPMKPFPTTRFNHTNEKLRNRNLMRDSRA